MDVEGQELPPISDIEYTDTPLVANTELNMLKEEDTEARNTFMGEGETKGHELIYSISDTPPWYICLILGFQHYLTMFGGTISVPLILAPTMCVTDSVVTSEIISTSFFVSGIITLLQVSFGVRLPIIQSSTFSFSAPALAIMSLPQWKCPDDGATNNSSNWNMTNITTESPSDGSNDIWKSRMCEIQGAIILASLFQVLVGTSGIIGFVLRFIGPIVIAPTITLIGLALFESASSFCSTNWCIAVLNMVLIITFSQYLRNINFPCLGYSKGKGCKYSSYPVFKLFPIILSVAVSWGLCAILTATDVIPTDGDHWAYGARTDTKGDVLIEAKWFRIPYPGQWGVPTFSVAAVFGMVSGILAGIIESIGDYYACARLSGAPPPPIHAINRGILFEGIGCVIAGLFGTGSGTTSYSENIGAIGITKVGSRRVVMFGGGIMIVLGMLGKFGALFVTIPDPIVGGLLMVMFGMIAAVGISNLQFTDMNSSRNLFIFGFALIFGLSLPKWMLDNPGIIQTGNTAIDQILTVLITTPMFVGGTIAFILDNTVPGTKEERGMIMWNKQIDHPEEHNQDKESIFEVYDFPFGMSFIRKWNWTKYIPTCPTFTGFHWSKSSTYAVVSQNNRPNDKDSVVVCEAGYSDLHHRKEKNSTSSDVVTSV